MSNAISEFVSDKEACRVIEANEIKKIVRDYHDINNISFILFVT